MELMEEMHVHCWCFNLNPEVLSMTYFVFAISPRNGVYACFVTIRRRVDTIQCVAPEIYSR